MVFCKYCGKEKQFVKSFGYPQGRLECVNCKCPNIIGWNKYIMPLKSGYPKDYKYVPPKVLYNEETGELLKK